MILRLAFISRRIPSHRHLQANTQVFPASFQALPGTLAPHRHQAHKRLAHSALSARGQRGWAISLVKLQAQTNTYSTFLGSTLGDKKSKKLLHTQPRGACSLTNPGHLTLPNTSSLLLSLFIVCQSLIHSFTSKAATSIGPEPNTTYPQTR